MSTGFFLIGAAVGLHLLIRLWVWCGEMADLAIKDDDMEEDPAMWTAQEWENNWKA